MPHATKPLAKHLGRKGTATSAREPQRLPSRESTPAIEALSTYYEQHHGQLFRFACSLTNDPHVAEDVLQQAYLNSADAITRGTEIRNLSAWMHRCIRNLCMDQMRRVQVDPLDEDANIEAPVTPASAFDAREQTRAINDAASSLPDHLRATFLLAEVRGFNYREIAVLLDRSVSSTAQILHRARARVRAAARIDDLPAIVLAPGTGAVARAGQWLRAVVERAITRGSEATGWLSSALGQNTLDRLATYLASPATAVLMVAGIASHPGVAWAFGAAQTMPGQPAQTQQAPLAAGSPRTAPADRPGTGAGVPEREQAIPAPLPAEDGAAEDLARVAPHVTSVSDVETAGEAAADPGREPTAQAAAAKMQYIAQATGETKTEHIASETETTKMELIAGETGETKMEHIASEAETTKEEHLAEETGETTVEVESGTNRGDHAGRPRPPQTPRGA